MTSVRSIDRSIARDQLAASLARNPREIPSLYGYDEMGSLLYAKIMRLPAYYLPQAETQLLTEHASSIVRSARCQTVVDLGAGTAEKTEILLAALPHSAHCVLLDIDEAIITNAAARLAAEQPHHTFSCINGTFREGIAHMDPGTEHPILTTFLGSTIGNLDTHERATLLEAVRRNASPGDSLFITADLHKSPDRIEAAYTCGYDGESGVRTRFALNRLEHLNRTWGADFQTGRYVPRAHYDNDAHEVIATLRSTAQQTVRIDDLDLTMTFDADEAIIRDRMRKFTVDELENELNIAGWAIESRWINESYMYAGLLAKV